jgi:hypothetical protein
VTRKVKISKEEITFGPQSLNELDELVRTTFAHELTAIRFNDDEKHELFMTKAFFID